jgi:hypothetical protein
VQLRANKPVAKTLRVDRFLLFFAAINNLADQDGRTIVRPHDRIGPRMKLPPMADTKLLTPIRFKFFNHDLKIVAINCHDFQVEVN